MLMPNSSGFSAGEFNHCSLPLLFSLGGFHRPPGLQTVKKRNESRFSPKEIIKKKNTYVLQKKCSDVQTPVFIATSSKDAEAEDVGSPDAFFWNEILPVPGFRLVGKRRNASVEANPVNKQTKWTNCCLYARVQDSNLAVRLARQRFPRYHVRTAKHITNKQKKPCIFFHRVQNLYFV